MMPKARLAIPVPRSAAMLLAEYVTAPLLECFHQSGPLVTIAGLGKCLVIVLACVEPIVVHVARRLVVFFLSLECRLCLVCDGLFCVCQ